MTRQVTLVCGPPCAGKNHHVEQHAGPDDIVLDYDAIARELGSPNQWDHPAGLITRTEAVMKRRMLEVGAMPDVTAWIIRTAPRRRQRERMARITRATDVVVLVPDEDTLRERAAHRSERTWHEIERWLRVHTNDLALTEAAIPTRKRQSSSRAWRTLRARVLRDEPLCQIRYDGICTVVSTTADHIIPVIARPDLEMTRANLQGACQPCNLAKGQSLEQAMPRASSAEALDFFSEG